MQQGGFESCLSATGTTSEENHGGRTRVWGGRRKRAQKVLRRLPAEDKGECTPAFLTCPPHWSRLMGRVGAGPGPETGQNLGRTIRQGEAGLTAEEFHTADVGGGGSVPACPMHKHEDTSGTLTGQPEYPQGLEDESEFKCRCFIQAAVCPKPDPEQERKNISEKPALLR